MSGKLRLPPVDSINESLPSDCLICGATPDADFQYTLADGKISMSVDRDLCLECAIHVWRAAKEKYGNGGVRFAAIQLLKAYSVTARAMARQHTGRPQ